MGKTRQDRVDDALRRYVLHGELGRVTPYVMAYMLERGYINEDGAATDFGVHSGISALTLREQCAFFDIPLIYTHAKTPMGKENAALVAMEDAGAGSAVFDEGRSVLVALHAKLKREIANYGERLPCLYIFAALESLRRDLGDDKYRRLIKAWLSRRINPVQSDILLSINAMRSLEGRSKRPSARSAGQIAAMIPSYASEFLEVLAQPRDIRSGWPDIVYVENGRLKWIEVKSSNKMAYDQIHIVRKMPLFVRSRLVVIRISQNPKHPSLGDAVSSLVDTPRLGVDV